MKLRILASLLTVALAGIMLGGATFAWFTSEAVSADNTITAGTLDVELGGTLPVEVSNIAPGDDPIETFVVIKNKGSLDMLFRIYVERDDENSSEDTNLEENLRVRVTLNPSEYPDEDIPEGFKRYGSKDNELISEMPLADLVGEDGALCNVSAAAGSWPLKEGYVAIYKFEIWLPETAGNDCQGRAFAGRLVVEGTQFDNQDLDNVQWDE